MRQDSTMNKDILQMDSSTKCFMISLALLLYCNSFGQSHPVQGERHSNISDAQFTKVLEAIWTERYKRKILNRLHLSEAPRLNTSIRKEDVWASMPYSIRDKFEREQRQQSMNIDYSPGDSDPKEAIIVAKPIPRCLRHAASGCFILDVVDNIPRDGLVSVTLQSETSDSAVKGRTLTLWEAYHSDQGYVSLTGPALGTIQVPEGEGIVPVPMDLTAAFKRWLRSRKIIRGKVARTIVIRCENCDFSGRSPVEIHKVVLEIVYHPLERQKRQIVGRCGGLRYRCCTKRYILNFEAVGWSQWVVFPNSFEPNYCRGGCSGGTNPQTHHAEVMQILARPDNRDNNITASLKRDMMPCCSPSEMASMTLMYLNEAGLVRMQTLHNLIVTKCGCM